MVFHLRQMNFLLIGNQPAVPYKVHLYYKLASVKIGLNAKTLTCMSWCLYCVLICYFVREVPGSSTKWSINWYS